MNNFSNHSIPTSVLGIVAMAALALALAIPARAVEGDAGSIMLSEQPQSGRTITGQVTDDAGEPLIGASVFLGNGKGTITDLDGNFTLEGVNTGDVLTVSFVGCTTQTVTVTSQNFYKIILPVSDQTLNELVVIGYGVQKKSNVTGAISSLKADDFLNTSATNAAASMQGKISGVQVMTNSGAPGATPTLRIRGYSSNGTSDPLYIVDGLKVDDISHLDANSIESMEVLKDAASAAIYGAEAGNGVVLVTTKRGSKGKTVVSFDAQLTISKLANKVSLMNASEFTNFYTEALGSDAFNSIYSAYCVDGVDTDWQDEFYETGYLQKYNLSVAGGNDNGTFFVGLGYLYNDGIVVMNKDYYDRITGQVNATYKIKPWLEVGTQNTILVSTSSTLSESNYQYGLLKTVMQADPLTPVTYGSSMPDNVATAIANGRAMVTNSKGEYYGLSYFLDDLNPVGQIEYTSSKYKVQNLSGSTYFNLTPIKNFTFTSRLGYTLSSTQAVSKVDTRWKSIDDPTTDSVLSLEQTTYQTRYYQWENYVNYLWETGVAGDFGFMAGMSYSASETDYTFGKTDELESDLDNYYYLSYSSSTATDYIAGEPTYKRKLAYYARISWDWLGRYNAQFNFRADAYDTSYLDADHRWGYFPSASIGWTFSEEPFLQGIVGHGFTYGKIRASYGVNGSISNLGSYAYAASLVTGTSGTVSQISNIAYYMDGELLTGVYPSTTLANPKLRWERSKQFDLGLDLRFFDARLTFTADYYHKLTDGLLINSTSQLTTGTSSVYQNVGEIVNKGVELELEWKDSIGDFRYGIKGNISFLDNKVKKYLGEGTRIDGQGFLSSSLIMTYFEEGYPLWYIRGYEYTGADPDTGEATFADLNGDGEIDDSDRTCLGSGIPDFTYGLTLTAAWKGFDLTVYGTGSSGNSLVYSMFSASSSSYFNRPTWLYDDRWTSTNTSGWMPAAVYQLNDERFYNSSAFVFDASYFKIKQIQLGYTLPRKALDFLGLSNLRVYASLENFVTFTDYPGSDPEVNSASYSASALALDTGGYPSSKAFMFGLNLTF